MLAKAEVACSRLDIFEDAGFKFPYANEVRYRGSSSPSQPSMKNDSASGLGRFSGAVKDSRGRNPEAVAASVAPRGLHDAIPTPGLALRRLQADEHHDAHRALHEEVPH